MTLEQQYKIAENIAAYVKEAIANGKCFSLTMERKAKLRKAFENINLKVRSRMSCQRAEYGNKEVVRQAIIDGLRNEPELPSWAERTKINDVTFWKHRTKGDLYFPFPLFGNGESQWLLDGKEVDKAQFKAELLASEFTVQPDREELAEKGQAAFRTPKVENIISII